MPAFSSKEARVFEERNNSVMSTPKDKRGLSRRVNYGNEHIEATGD